MKMRIWAIAIWFVPLAGWAQAPTGTCDQTLSMTIASEGASRIKTTIAYYGLGANEVAAMQQERQKTLDLASKQQDKKGPFALTLSTSGTCPAANAPDIVLQGVTGQGVRQIINKSAQIETAHSFKKMPGHHRQWGE